MRILIATVTAGGGHLAAAAALEEAWRSFRPADELKRIDLLGNFSLLHRKLYAEGYVQLVERAPELWGLMFKATDNLKITRRLQRLKRFLPGNSAPRFARQVNVFKPDAVLCTHFLPLEILEDMARKERSVAPLVVSIVTDFEAHALWMNPCVDLYCVAAEETKARLVARGAMAENILPTGIPISSAFSTTPNPAAVRRRYGWRDELPLVLVLSGGFGMGPVAEILAELDRVSVPLQTVVVAGRNEALRKKLAAQDRQHPTQIMGFVNNMSELMTVAELIITKPGGLTVSEALALGKPLFILNPIPGQEAANSDFLLEHGAAVKVNRVEDLSFRVQQLLGSGKLTTMARAARDLGRPEAAQEICRQVRHRLQPEYRNSGRRRAHPESIQTAPTRRPSRA